MVRKWHGGERGLFGLGGFGLLGLAVVGVMWWSGAESWLEGSIVAGYLEWFAGNSVELRQLELW